MFLFNVQSQSTNPRDKNIVTVCTNNQNIRKQGYDSRKMTLRQCATGPGVKTIELWRNLISTLTIDLIQQCGTRIAILVITCKFNGRMMCRFRVLAAAGLVALVALGFGGRFFGQNTQVIHVHGDFHVSGSDRKHESKEWKTYRPLIGILSQGGSPAPDGSSYIASSYVKFVESAGARAVPILHDMSHAEVCIIQDMYSHVLMAC
jgi:hypothetical protein